LTGIAVIGRQAEIGRMLSARIVGRRCLLIGGLMRRDTRLRLHRIVLRLFVGLQYYTLSSLMSKKLPDTQ